MITVLLQVTIIALLSSILYATLTTKRVIKKDPTSPVTVSSVFNDMVGEGDAIGADVPLFRGYDTFDQGATIYDL